MENLVHRFKHKQVKQVLSILEKNPKHHMSKWEYRKEVENWPIDGAMLKSTLQTQ